MFYFPILEGTYPKWMPFWGGQNFVFFRPVFNIADSAITTGVLFLLIFQRQFFQNQGEDKQSETAEIIAETTTETIENTNPLIDEQKTSD
jgi:signal peptidase II